MIAWIAILMIAAGLCVLLVVIFCAAEELKLLRRETALKENLWRSGGLVKPRVQGKGWN